jgi:hypothetical protein
MSQVNAPSAPSVRLDPTDPMARQDPLDPQDPREHPETQELALALLEPPERPEIVDRREPKVQPVQLAHLALMEPRYSPLSTNATILIYCVL